MTSPSLAIGASVVLEARDLQLLLDALAGKGYRLVGPTLRRGELIYGDLATVADLPVGWRDEQEGGTFRLQKRQDQAQPNPGPLRQGLEPALAQRGPLRQTDRRQSKAQDGGARQQRQS